MRLPIVLALALCAAPASAQLAPPSEVRSLTFPILVHHMSGDATFGTGEEVTFGGIATPTVGFVMLRIPEGGGVYRRFDWSGSMAWIQCITSGVLGADCQGAATDGAPDDDDGWAAVHGIILPVFEIGRLWRAGGIGEIGGGVHIGNTFVVDGRDQLGADDGRYAYLDVGGQLAHAADVAGFTALTTATYAAGIGTPAGSFSARAFTIQLDAVRPSPGRVLGFSRDLSVRAFFERRTDAFTNDDGNDEDLAYTLVGIGVGFLGR